MLGFVDWVRASDGKSVKCLTMNMYRRYHTNSPPPFLADFGCSSKSGLSGKPKISRYHTNPPPHFFNEKNAPGGWGISMISTVFKREKRKNRVRASAEKVSNFGPKTWMLRRETEKLAPYD